jgi:hypothetical protein
LRCAVWIDPARLPPSGSPRRRVRRTAAQQLPRRRGPDEGRPGADQPVANTDLRSVESSRTSCGRAERRRGTTARGVAGSSSAPRSELRRQVRREGRRLPGIWTQIGVNEIEVPSRAQRRMERIRRCCRRTSTCRWPTRHDVHGEPLEEITKTSPRRSSSSPWWCSLHGLGAHRARTAGGHADLAHGRRHRDVGRGVQSQPADDLAIVLRSASSSTTHRGGRERGAARARGPDAHRRGADRRARADGPGSR